MAGGCLAFLLNAKRHRPRLRLRRRSRVDFVRATFRKCQAYVQQTAIWVRHRVATTCVQVGRQVLRV
jgi:hypothetical protein